MTDHTSAHADEVLGELVELIETARTLPMSSSCVVPRERVLDLLDALRDVLPPEMAEARRVVAQRDKLLNEAAERAAEMLRSAEERAEQVTLASQSEAGGVLKQAEAERARLVSAEVIRRGAAEQAARISESATLAAQQVRAEAHEYVARMTAEAHAYAETTLEELIGHLKRLLVTAENGRAALDRTLDGADRTATRP